MFYGREKENRKIYYNLFYMFKKLKEKISIKKKEVKKAAFLAAVAYVYDKITNRKKLKKKEYIDGVEYEVNQKKKKFVYE